MSEVAMVVARWTDDSLSVTGWGLFWFLYALFMLTTFGGRKR